MFKLYTILFNTNIPTYDICMLARQIFITFFIFGINIIVSKHFFFEIFAIFWCRYLLFVLSFVLFMFYDIKKNNWGESILQLLLSSKINTVYRLQRKILTKSYCSKNIRYLVWIVMLRLYLVKCVVTYNKSNPRPTQA